MKLKVQNPCAVAISSYSTIMITAFYHTNLYLVHLHIESQFLHELHELF